MSIYFSVLCGLVSFVNPHNAYRDLLNGTIPEDIDFATDATPKQMEVMFKLHDFNLIHTKVQEHGIFTVVVENQKFEVCIDSTG